MKAAPHSYFDAVAYYDEQRFSRARCIEGIVYTGIKMRSPFYSMCYPRQKYLDHVQKSLHEECHRSYLARDLRSTMEHSESQPRRSESISQLNLQHEVEFILYDSVAVCRIQEVTNRQRISYPFFYIGQIVASELDVCHCYAMLRFEAVV